MELFAVLPLRTPVQNCTFVAQNKILKHTVIQTMKEVKTSIQLDGCLPQYKVVIVNTCIQDYVQFAIKKNYLKVSCF